MNRRTLCILFVLVSIAFAISNDEDKRKGSAKNAAPTGNFSSVPSIKEESEEEKKPDESATPAKRAHATDSFFTIGALAMAAVYIA